MATAPASGVASPAASQLDASRPVAEGVAGVACDAFVPP